MEQIAIIGFGCAGYNGARALRASGFTGGIHVYESTQEPPANPMLTTYYVSGRLEEKEAYPFGGLESITRELNICLHSGETVRRVLPDRSILLADGRREAFDKILISTGARAVVPALKGPAGSRVFLMRTMDDARRMKHALEQGSVQKAVVVGASMVGIKVAELLLNRGVDVTLADFAPYLFPLAAFETVARELEHRVAEKGIHFKWNAGLKGNRERGQVQ